MNHIKRYTEVGIIPIEYNISTLRRATNGRAPCRVCIFSSGNTQYRLFRGRPTIRNWRVAQRAIRRRGAYLSRLIDTFHPYTDKMAVYRIINICREIEALTFMFSNINKN